MSEKFWDRTASNYDDGMKKHEGNYDATIQQALSQLTINDTVLDLGCASGEMSLDIAPHVKHLHGIDISQEMIKLANDKAYHRGVSNVTFQQLDLFDDSLSDKQFDAVIAFNILHLLPDIPSTLDRLHNLLTPNGRLITITPCLGNLNGMLQLLFKGIGMVGFLPKIHSLTVTELEQILDSHGFDIVESDVWDTGDNTRWIATQKR